MSGVDVIIPNYNGDAPMIAENLDSVFGQSHGELGVTVVDNGSEPRNLRVFEAYRGRVDLVQMGENTGFGRAVNAGIRATARPLVLLLNNDVVLAPDAVATLAQVLEGGGPEGELGGVNALMLRYRDRGVVDSAGIGFSSRWQHQDLLCGRPAAAVGGDRDLAGLCAGAALYRRRFFEDVGLFDEAMFLVFEDVDLSLRGLWRGWRYRLASRAVCYHRRGATTAGLQETQRSRGFDRVKASSKYNHLRYVAKNFPAGVALRKLAYLAQKDLVDKLARGCPSTRAAYGRFLRDLPEVRRARRRIMGRRRVDPSEFRKLVLEPRG